MGLNKLPIVAFTSCLHSLEGVFKPCSCRCIVCGLHCTGPQVDALLACGVVPVAAAKITIGVAVPLALGILIYGAVTVQVGAASN